MIGIRSAGNWLESVRERESFLVERWQSLYGDSEAVIASRAALYTGALETFIQHNGSERDVLISRAPGRVNLLGNHIEHRGGTVNYMAVDRETLLVASPRTDDTLVLTNANPERFPRAEFSIGESLPAGRRGNWLDVIKSSTITRGNWVNYVAASVLALQNRFPNQALKGMDIAVHGDIPIGAGLSSSSSLVVSAMEAMLAFNDIDIPEEEKATFCGEAEWYVGTRGGAGDHAAMLYARRQALVRLRFFPLTTDEIPLPEGYRVVACNSFVEHQSTSVFNERIATYEIGLMLVKSAFPHYAPRLDHLRDLTADHLGVSEADIYRILKILPTRMSRDEIRSSLPDQTERLSGLFAPHDDPEDGYRVRQVVLFGLAECARGHRCGELLKEGRIQEMGRLKGRSHDGDRRFRFANGIRKAVENAVTDADLDALIASQESGDVDRASDSRMYNQAGGYDCSCEELDLIVDLATEIWGSVDQ